MHHFNWYPWKPIITNISISLKLLPSWELPSGGSPWPYCLQSSTSLIVIISPPLQSLPSIFPNTLSKLILPSLLQSSLPIFSVYNSMMVSAFPIQCHHYQGPFLLISLLPPLSCPSPPFLVDITVPSLIFCFHTSHLWKFTSEYEDSSTYFWGHLVDFNISGELSWIIFPSCIDFNDAYCSANTPCIWKIASLPTQHSHHRKGSYTRVKLDGTHVKWYLCRLVQVYCLWQIQQQWTFTIILEAKQARYSMVVLLVCCWARASPQQQHLPLTVVKYYGV